MKTIISSFLQRNKTFKILGSIFLTIFLGAVGSGLWDRFLSKIYDASSNAFLATASLIFKGYVNNLHAEIGIGRTDQMVISIYAFVISIAISFPWMFVGWVFLKLKHFERKINLFEDEDSGNVQQSEEAKEQVKKSVKNLRKFTLYVMIPMAIITTMVYLNSAFKDGYTRRASIFIERSIDILAPHIPYDKLLDIRAKYRSIDNANKFYILEEDLKNSAVKFNVEIPKFKSIK